MTSHVNIYFCRRPLQKSSLENIAMMSIFLYVSWSIEIFFLCCELSSNNAWCCRADANINSLRLRRRELLLRNLPSDTMRYSTIMHSIEYKILAYRIRISANYVLANFISHTLIRPVGKIKIENFHAFDIHWLYRASRYAITERNDHHENMPI